jgi:hypothetical protein
MTVGTQIAEAVDRVSNRIQAELFLKYMRELDEKQTIETKQVAVAAAGK